MNLCYYINPKYVDTLNIQTPLIKGQNNKFHRFNLAHPYQILTKLTAKKSKI